MKEYEILTREYSHVVDDMGGYEIWDVGPEYDIVLAETPAKAKYIFYQRHFKPYFYTFHDAITTIAYCRVYHCEGGER